MASLFEIRDMLALHGKMEACTLSNALQTPLAMMEAMLGRMEALGKARRVQEDPGGCLSGQCRECPDGKACLREWWMLC
ncbi:[Fe-S]-dependent transcriptional repressor FeoC [Enterobacter sp. ENT03]|uniref:[Fe-S]-dependent transcriptional repressor FeoC n=1 Tax=Enterobacter sp. ENT03 TaxID=2854780 RepID=UPI001C44F6BA|nr:[Fe-S]-dependent transcriptional repressor FeoC [Enterobacter sp. ENT03]MBV7406369.1 [Fe-S]-dependent transcriptional repressor FeoC [Enterobacter sp. ENT03]